MIQKITVDILCSIIEETKDIFHWNLISSMPDDGVIQIDYGEGILGNLILSQDGDYQLVTMLTEFPQYEISILDINRFNRIHPFATAAVDENNCVWLRASHCASHGTSLESLLQFLQNYYESIGDFINFDVVDNIPLEPLD